MMLVVHGWDVTEDSSNLEDSGQGGGILAVVGTLEGPLASKMSLHFPLKVAQLFFSASKVERNHRSAVFCKISVVFLVAYQDPSFLVSHRTRNR